jgi:hypothetical protein
MRILSIIFLLSLSAFAATCTFSGTVDQSFDNASNWDAAPGSGDSCVINSNCSLYTAISVKSINIIGSTTFRQNKKTITVANYFRVATSGTYQLDTSLTITGNGSFTIANSGTASIGSLRLYAQGTDSIISSKASITAKAISCACSGYTTTLCSPPNTEHLTLNGGTWFLGGSGNPTIDVRDNSKIFTNASGSSITGTTRVIFIRDNSTTSNTDTMDAFTYTTMMGVPLTIYKSGTNGKFTLHLAGKITVADTLRSYISSAAPTMLIYTHGHGIKAKTLQWGPSNASGKYRVDMARGDTVDISHYDGAAYNTGLCTLSLASAVFRVSGDWKWGSNTLPINDTSLVIIDSASTITSSGVPFNTLNINAATYNIALADSVKAKAALMIDDGSFNQSGKHVNAPVVRVAGGTNTFNALLTLPGANDSLVVTGGTNTFASCTASIAGNAYIQLSDTINRLICADSMTYTFHVGDTTKITANSAGDWSGSSGKITAWKSSSTGSPFYISAPAGVSVSYMSIRDCRNIGTVVDARGTGMVNAGNNSGWRFAIVADSLRPVSGGAGTSINIKGKCLNGASVVIGGISQTVSASTDTTAALDVSGLNAGKYAAYIKNEYGDSIYTDSFTVTTSSVPVITRLLPSFGNPAGGWLDTIEGATFGESQGGGSVKYGPNTATVQSWGDVQIIVTVPAYASYGPVNLVVAASSGQTDTAQFIYDTTVVATGATPDHGHSYGSDTITISLINAGTVDTVKVGSYATYTSFVNHSNTQVRFVSLGGLQGDTADIYIRNTKGYRDTLADAFRFNYIPIAYCSSDDSANGGDTAIFYCDHAGATRGSGSLYFDSTQALGYVYWSDDSIGVVVPNGYGLKSIILTTSDGEKDTCTDGIFITGSVPWPFTFSPDSGTVRGGDWVNISLPGSWYSTPGRVRIGGLLADSVSLINQALGRCKTPKGYYGLASADAISSTGDSVHVDSAFTYTIPSGSNPNAKWPKKRDVKKNSGAYGPNGNDSIPEMFTNQPGR